jgi:hypothetical protein
MPIKTAAVRIHHDEDAAAGDQARPYLTLSKAAAVAQPGDTVTVHAGTYREWVKPARGGTGEQGRITYRAAAGEEVLIKGSERITSWAPEGDGVWKAELPNAFFGDYNPYALTLSGGWLEYGQWHHRGDVYLNGEALGERQTPEAVKQQEGTWHCQVVQQTTFIRANFGRADPNRELVEINVRESVFMPLESRLKYITVEGFHLMHSAENWEPPGLAVQMGTIGPRMGKHWIIQNCRVTNARCVGIVIGHAPGVDYDDIDAFGDHVIRHNVIRRCGQAGIAGQKGATRCLVAGNLIEDTNYRKEFGGWETAAIKFHHLRRGQGAAGPSRPPRRRRLGRGVAHRRADHRGPLRQGHLRGYGHSRAESPGPRPGSPGRSQAGAEHRHMVAGTRAARRRETCPVKVPCPARRQAAL